MLFIIAKMIYQVFKKNLTHLLYHQAADVLVENPKAECDSDSGVGSPTEVMTETTTGTEAQGGNG